MSFTRNIQFILVIPVNNRKHEFNFRKRTSELYDGDVGDVRGERFYFKMIKQNDQWVVADRKAPTCLLEREPLIRQGIVQQEE